MKTIQQQIDVMQHFANGGEIERRFLWGAEERWMPHTCGTFDWSHFDYRIKEADPYAELKAAAADPTKQIRLLHTLGTGIHSDWEDAGYGWRWSFPPKDYEIRNKPRKVKLLAWLRSDGHLVWRGEHHPMPPHWLRVPSEDKEIEVES